MVLMIKLAGKKFEMDFPKETAEEMFKMFVSTCLEIDEVHELVATEEAFEIEETDVEVIPPKAVEEVGQRPQESDLHGYRGFLHLKCEHCGKVKSFMPKNPMEQYHCNECGGDTILKDMCTVLFTCPNCGKSFKYQTNRYDASFSMECVNCGSLVGIKYNSEKRSYEGVADGR